MSDKVKVVIKKACRVGGAHVKQGATVEVTPNDAKEMVARGKAEYADKAAGGKGPAKG